MSTPAAFYISLQLRYKSLCIKYGFVPNTQEFLENDGANILDANQPKAMAKKKSEKQQIIDAKNYMSIFGKFMSKC